MRNTPDMFPSAALAVTMQVLCLSNKLREMILLKSCLLMIRAEMKSETQPYVDVYVALASVCDWFYEIVSDKHFCAGSDKLSKVCLRSLT